MTDPIIVTPPPPNNIAVTFGQPGARGVQGIQGIQGIQGVSGLGPVPNVLYVAKNGNDANDGLTLKTAKLTIKSAMAIATAGTTVFVKSGDYTEQNPVTIPANVSLVGDSLRSVTIRPQTTNVDLFYVNNGCYITEVTFKSHVSPAAAVAFNPNGSAGLITASPYVYNCSSITTTGKGMYIDGDVVTGNKSMVSGQYTQFNQGGIGIHIVNSGYAQLVGIYTICCETGILCEDGGFCSLIGSDTSFGNFGLVARGTSPMLDSGTVTGISTDRLTLTVSGCSQQPRINDVIKLSSENIYYTIDTISLLSPGVYNVTILEKLAVTAGLEDHVDFYKPSLISAAGHTFEYAGAGTNVATALPQLGGIPDQTKEVVQENGGKVFYTSTDQKGDFRIGGELLINRADGTITGTAFDKSLFAVMTPYILAIEG